MSSGSAEISEEEFAKYDRQIRLWGLETQKRLRQAKVLVAGLGGLGSEVVKNVVLSGVKAITLLDDKDVTEIDMYNQLLITHEHIGQNRAEASKSRAQELNPNVIVTADTSPIYNKKEHFFKEFDIVCLTEVPLELRLKINQVCRMEKIKFFCGDVFGFYGYSFADLGMHEYVKEETRRIESGADIGSGEPASKKQKSDANAAQEETILKEDVEEFCSLEESFKEDWSKRSRRSMRQSSHVFFIIQIIDKFRKINKRLPCHNEEDYTQLVELRSEVLQHAKISESYIPIEFPEYCVSQLNPVCAIVGGVMGQEIIKAASRRDAPHNNYFFFDGKSHSGIVDQICPPFQKMC